MTKIEFVLNAVRSLSDAGMHVVSADFETGEIKIRASVPEHLDLDGALIGVYEAAKNKPGTSPKIEAIKYHREKTGSLLKDAKNYVECLLAKRGID